MTEPDARIPDRRPAAIAWTSGVVKFAASELFIPRPPSASASLPNIVSSKPWASISASVQPFCGYDAKNPQGALLLLIAQLRHCIPVRLSPTGRWLRPRADRELAPRDRSPTPDGVWGTAGVASSEPGPASMEFRLDAGPNRAGLPPRLLEPHQRAEPRAHGPQLASRPIQPTPRSASPTSAPGGPRGSR